MTALSVQVNLPVTGWTSVTASKATVIRRIGSAEAVFTVAPAAVADRVYCRPGREVRIVITAPDGTAIRFAGYVERPVVQSRGPKQFALEVHCVGLEYGATLPIVWDRTYPDAIMPVTGPTYVQPDAAAGKDTYVWLPNPDTNYGDVATLHIGRAPNNGRILVQFDLSFIPAGSRIDSAVLSLYQTGGEDGDPAQEFDVYAITSPWDEMTVTWNTKPSRESRPQTATVVKGANDWYSWDVTYLVQRWVDGDIPNHGFQIEDHEEHVVTLGADKLFHSSDSGSPSVRPKLTLTYHQPIPYTTAIADLWENYWPAVDRSRIVASAKQFSQQEVLQYRTLGQATERFLELLEDYVWWIEYDAPGGVDTYFLRLEPANMVKAETAIGELDINWAFEMEPSVLDIRNQIYVVGGEGGGDPPGSTVDYEYSEADYPIRGFDEDAASQARFGVRPLIVRDNKSMTREQAIDRATRELKAQAWEYHRVELGVTNYALGPGDHVDLHLPTVGVDGVVFGDAYMVVATTDRYERGAVQRAVTLREREAAP